MKMKSLLGIMLSLGILQSCQNDETNIIQNEVNNKGITFSSIIDDAQNSRAYDTSWEANDVIGVFMLANSDNVLATNIPYVTSKGDGYFVSQNRPIYYPDGPVDFIAYYPYSEAISDHTNYPIDLSNQTAQSAIDLMTAVNLTNRELGSTQGNLQFKHLLAKLVLNLKSTSGSSLKGIKASISGLKVKGTADLSADGSITPSGEATTFSLYIDEEATKAEAILLPQALTGNLKIKLELNGQSKEITTQIAGSIEQGNKYICNVNISSKGGEITTDPEAKYTKWFETPVITESQLNNTNFAYTIRYMRNGMKAPHGGTMRNYTMFYDKTLKFAYWVSYPLFKECIGTYERTDPWRYDDLIESKWQADLSSGFGDSYDRGHQLPSGDRTCDKVTNDDTFFFTNATPQVRSMNQGIWNTLEGKVRNWMSATDTLYVVTGAMPPTTNISYRKGMAIPEYYFKAIARKSGSTYQTIAFKMANQNIPGNYMEYAISVSELEKQTGFIFFPQLSSSIKEQLNTNLWN